MSKKLKALGLALIVVCAFGAASASAQSAPKFTVSGITSGTEKIAETATPTGTLTLTVPGLLRITCTTLKIKDGTIKVGTDENSAESLVFGGCSVDGPAGEPLPGCTIKNVGGTAGTIATSPVTSTLVNVGEEGYITFKPTGTNFVSLRLEGSPCALEGTYNMTGSIGTTIGSPKPGVLQTTTSLVASEAVQKAGRDKLLVGTGEWFLDATVGLHLVSDKSWGFDL
jgi:hypothetical protein